MPLLLSRQVLKSNELNGWLHKDVSELNVIGSYNLINNAALLLSKSQIYIITIAKLLNDDREIIFIKFEPELKSNIYFALKNTKFCQKLDNYF